MSLYYLVNHLLNESMGKNNKELGKTIYEAILNESHNDRAIKSDILYSELLASIKKLYSLLIKGHKISKINTYYLKLVCYHYYQEDNVINLLDDLMKEQDVNFINIEKILNYHTFKDWHTMKHYIHKNKGLIFCEASHCKYYETSFYKIYLDELDKHTIVI